MRRVRREWISAGMIVSMLVVGLLWNVSLAAAAPVAPLVEYLDFSGEIVLPCEATPEGIEKAQYGVARIIARQAATALAATPEFSGRGYSVAQLSGAAFGALQLLEVESKLQNLKNQMPASLWLRGKGRVDLAKMKMLLDSRMMTASTMSALVDADESLTQLVDLWQEMNKQKRPENREKISRRLQETEKRFKVNVWILKGNRALLVGDYPLAEEAYSRGLEMNGEILWLLIARGDARYHQGSYERAVQDYSAALSRDNRQAIVYYYRGNAYYYQNLYDEALADYTAALVIDPLDAAALYNRGNIYRKKDLLEKAVTDYTAALAINPRMANGYANRGDVYARLNKIENALADYQEALALDPGDATVLYSRGNLYSQQGSYDAAVADYSAALAVDPRLAGAYQNRGAAYLKKNLFVQAAADFDQALTLDPHYAVAYYNKAVALEKLAFIVDTPSVDMVVKIRQIIDAYQRFLHYAPAGHPGIGRAHERIRFLESRTMVLDI